MRRKKQRSQLDAIDQINVTPLLDLTFLLLIVFMISMPLLETGLGVNTPKMNARELPRDQYKSLNLKADGSIWFDRAPVTREQLAGLLAKLKREHPETVVLLRGDGARPYQDIIGLLRDIRNSGFTGITLVTSPEDPKK